MNQVQFYVGGRWAHGGTGPQIHLFSPDSKAIWQFWRDFWGPKMLQNSNFLGELTVLPRASNWWGGGSLPPALYPSRLASTGLRIFGLEPPPLLNTRSGLTLNSLSACRLDLESEKNNKILLISLLSDRKSIVQITGKTTSWWSDVSN